DRPRNSSFWMGRDTEDLHCRNSIVDALLRWGSEDDQRLAHGLIFRSAATQDSATGNIMAGGLWKCLKEGGSLRERVLLACQAVPEILA
ncbi:hypothetical protein ABTL33_19230, partial [Acinetobacter baumannii]